MTARSLSQVWSRPLSKVAAVGGFAALTALTARIAIPLPFTPVPITLQVLAVLLSGLVLGARGGAAAQLAYLAAILVGLPYTASGIAGPAAFAGPTAGYLLAFPLAALGTGRLAERWSYTRLRALFAALVGVAVIYIGGTSWLAVWLGGNLARAWTLGAAPFLLVDLVKAAVAAGVAASGRRVLAVAGWGESTPGK